MGAVTLTGSNRFLINQYLRERVDGFIKENGDMGLERLDAEELEAGDILSRVGSVSMFTPKKLVILRGLTKNSLLAEQLDELLAGANADTDLIIVEQKIDRRSKLFTKLKSESEFKELVELRASELSSWLVNQAKMQGGSMPRDAAAYLVDRVGENQELLASELTKLLIYSPTVDKHSIDLLVEPNPQGTGFELLDATFAKNRKRVVKLYEEQRAQKIDPNQIVGLLAWQLHLVAAVKVAQGKSHDAIARDLSVKPGAISKSATIARNVSLVELSSLLARLLEIDLKLKRKSANPDDALLYFLLSF